MVEVEYTEDVMSGDIIGKFRVTKADRVMVKLDDFYRAVINSEIKSSADVFQNLEILARRIEEQTNGTK